LKAKALTSKSIFEDEDNAKEFGMLSDIDSKLDRVENKLQDLVGTDEGCHEIMNDIHDLIKLLNIPRWFKYV
jgi:hypothetical protein